MAVYELEIPDDQQQEVFDAFCAEYGYVVEDGLTPAQFTRKVVTTFITTTVVNHKMRQAEASLREQVMASMATIS